MPRRRQPRNTQNECGGEQRLGDEGHYVPEAEGLVAGEFE